MSTAVQTSYGFGFPKGPGLESLYISTVVPAGQFSIIHFASVTHNLTQPAEAVPPN